MTSEQILLVQASFAMFVRDKERVLSLFYERLFELDPSLRPLFRGNLARQRSRLALAIATIVHGLKNPGTIVPVLHELGRRHVGFGVRPEHYALYLSVAKVARPGELGGGARDGRARGVSDGRDLSRLRKSRSC